MRSLRPAAMLLLLLTGCGGAAESGAKPAGAPPAICSNRSTGQPAIAPLLRAQSEDIILTHATIWTGTGAPLTDSWIRFSKGRITQIGSSGAPKVNTDGGGGAKIIDATGKWVTAGIIDTHSHLGVYPSPNTSGHDDGNEATGPTTPEVSSQDSVWVQDPGFERALRGGVTAMQILPGSANLVGGRGFVMKNKRGARVAEQLRFPGSPETLKMACGENPKRVYGEQGRMPSTRMGNIATIRQMWIDAAEYRKQWDDYNAKLDGWCAADNQAGNPPDAPSRDLGKETLAEVLRGHILPQIHCYQADDMLNQIQVADEMGFAIRSFHHAVEAYKIRDVLAAKQIAISTWPDWWGFKIEAYDTINEGPGLLTEAGARAVLKSDSPITNQRLGQEAGKALAAARSAGIKLDENDAIRWVTANAAWALGIDQLAGTLEVGKMADIVVWDHQPLSTYASAVWVFVDGIAELDPTAPPDPWSDFEAGTNNHVRGGR